MEGLATPGDITAGMSSCVGVDGCYNNGITHFRDMIQYSLSYITEVCDLELTCPCTASAHCIIYSLRTIFIIN